MRQGSSLKPNIALSGYLPSEIVLSVSSEIGGIFSCNEHGYFSGDDPLLPAKTIEDTPAAFSNLDAQSPPTRVLGSAAREHLRRL
jgi:hypothetical protein